MEEYIIGKTRLQLSKMIGEGGEGRVFEIVGHAGHAVKIYHEEHRASRERKVRAMVQSKLSLKTELVAYPNEIVLNKSRNFSGFLMRYVPEHRPLHYLYTPKSRQRHFPATDYRFLVRAALNTVRAVGQVHQTGCIIGDLNHSGVLVSQKATVALIDADSFQFELNGERFPCLVGVEEFLPPELQRIKINNIVRTAQHDLFGLAVAIFHLLFLGRHPYAGISNEDDLSFGESIHRNKFAFSLIRRSETKTSPPPGSITLDLLPSFVSSAFERAFGLNPSSRPLVKEWIVVLKRLERSLTRCRKVDSHYYPNSSKECLWCSLAAKSGFDPFPQLSPSTKSHSARMQVSSRIIHEILSFRFPSVSDFLSISISLERGPSDALKEAKGVKLSDIFWGLISVFIAIYGFFIWVEIWVFWLVVAGWGLLRFKGPVVPTKPFIDRYIKADESVSVELDAFLHRKNLKEVMFVRVDLDAKIAAYERLDDDLLSELRKLRYTRETRQRTAYLDQFQIRHSKIPGIGPAKTACLVSFGIETAADVDWSSVLAVPGFGEYMTRKLVDWRKGHEARFRYSPVPSSKDSADELAVRSIYKAKRVKLEADILSGLAMIRSARPQLKNISQLVSGDTDLINVLKVRAHAEQDLKILGVKIPPSKVKFNMVR